MQEAYRHHKTPRRVGPGVEALCDAGVGEEAAGVITGPKVAKPFNDALVESLGWHRHWDR